ncbi:hypothetical protein BG015_002613 [Linnemannia schmuckeri]|uniref:Glutathione S-transferase n=1 Tax=Linnemannia schmuckeri TaxID=64567 RepID=A0A9P5VDH6_9FUNG|nr:hypothetical protein BG015_002613 [Linnemannia schmuckeri]
MSPLSTSNSDLILAKENVHHLTYFPFHGLAGCIRTTLVLLGEPYEDHTLSFKEWMAQKSLTPFGHIPVLREVTKCGKSFEIAEISAIEFFLAKRSGNLLGKDFWEESQIRMFHSSTHALFTFLVHTVVQSPQSDRAAFLARFKKTNLPQWIRSHEKYLVANGSNGHYVGDQLSIADIKTASVIEHLINLTNGEGETPLISEELTPAIMAVKSNLEKHPQYAGWRTSQQYQEFTNGNLRFFGF